MPEEGDKPERAQHLPRNVAMLEQAVKDRTVDQAHLEGRFSPPPPQIGALIRRC